MRRDYDGTPQYSLPRPGPVLKATLLVLLSVWLVLALGINWVGLPKEAFFLLAGSTQSILDGELWRLVTAPLVHWPYGGQGVGHIVTTLLGLYFLAPELERTWGGARFLRFLWLSAIVGYTLQLAVELMLPASQAQKLVGPIWFGALPTIEAVAIAWALSFRGQTVRLMFVLPVSSRGLIVFVVAMSVLYLIAGAQRESGLIAPFGGMLVGWLLGGGNPSPARRFWLKWRYKSLERAAERTQKDRRQRVARSGLRVIEGGAAPAGDDAIDEPAPGNGKGKQSGVGPDGKLLN
jgi:membrane associated rhomboid family serine protease